MMQVRTDKDYRWSSPRNARGVTIEMPKGFRNKNRRASRRRIRLHCCRRQPESLLAPFLLLSCLLEHLSASSLARRHDFLHRLRARVGMFGLLVEELNVRIDFSLPLLP